MDQLAVDVDLEVPVLFVELLKHVPEDSTVPSFDAAPSGLDLRTLGTHNLGERAMPSPARFRNVVPTLRYDDAPAAIDWLCKAFQFEAALVVPGEADGTIAHSELRCGPDTLMVSSVTRGMPFDSYMTSVRETKGRETVSVYVIVENVDDHYEVAKQHGAEILLDIVDQDYGGRGYTCRDPQGHVWSFGSYDPLASDGES